MPPANDDNFQRVIDFLDRNKTHHDRFVSKVEERYRVYKGVIERRSQADQWNNKLAPAYVQQIIETIVANMLDDRVTFRMRPRPMRADMMTMGMVREGARQFEALLSYQADQDKLTRKQRPFVLQGSIAGLTVMKQSWLSKQGTYRYPVKRIEETYDDAGFASGEREVSVDEEVEYLWRDDPSSEVVDVRDFIWPEAATNLTNAADEGVAHRVWMTRDQMLALQQKGIFQNVDELNEENDFRDEFTTREEVLFQVDRTKRRTEVIEHWTNDRVVTIANRQVKLRDKPNPFWFEHLEHKLPFVTASPVPDLFRIPGISDVERMADLQEMLWTVGNQRLDNLMLLNNAIILMRDDVDDPDMFEFAPGEKWLVTDPGQVSMWTPDPRAAEISLSAEAMIKTDLQNITGNLPFAGGVMSEAVNQETATGISIVTSLAQRLLIARKAQYALAWEEIGDQWIALDQQYIREPRLIEVLGPDGATVFKQVFPDSIQGHYRADVQPVAEQIMKQERRAEAQAVLQVAAQVAPLAAAMGVPMNIRAFIEDYLREFGRDDVDKYFSAQPQQALPPGGGQGGPPAPGGNGGVTSPMASNELSPSNATSLSPQQFMQRSGAMRGGPVNQ